MQNLDETKTVQALVNNQYGGFSDAIFFASSVALKIDDEIRECRLHVATEVLRQSLGLIAGMKPGDIDLLIIPEIEGEFRFDRTMAIEVKVVRPTLEKPGKNASKMGSTQAKGLAQDGFPIVGLLHLEVPELSPEENKVQMPNGYMMDFFPLESATRQKGRLASLDLPKCIGFSSTGLQSGENDFLGNTFGFDKSPTINPCTSSKLLELVEKYYFSEKRNFTTIETYG